MPNAVIRMLTNEIRGKIPEETTLSISRRGIREFTPPQEIAINAGLLEGKNILVAAPTASGKTLISELAATKSIIHRRKKAIYIAPMRALVSEKFAEFREEYPFIKAAISIGDLDSNDSWLKDYEMIFASTEKFDSLMRHGIEWLDEIGCITFDEIHMLGESDRGPTLEILITRLTKLCESAQIIALSATVGNADELGRWLRAEVVISDYRPVPIRRGIIFKNAIYSIDGESELEGTSQLPEIRVAEDTIRMGKQALVFYSTKRNAEAGAEKIGKIIGERKSEDYKARLDELAAQVLSVLSRPTLQCEKLADTIRNGTAFHHSGLVNEQRKLIEDAFKANLIKVICSTTTLGLGVNLPAHTVLVRDTTRYSSGEGSSRLGVNEVIQLLGRAGRPKYDTEGRALLIAKTKNEVNELYRRYISAPPDPITSNLAIIPILRMHVLSFIASRFLITEESIMGFLADTFYGKQYGDMFQMKKIVGMVLKDLSEWEFIKKSGNAYTPTRIGERVSELYIDPLSAKCIIDLLPKANGTIPILFMISNTVEMRPYIRPVEKAEEEFVKYAQIAEEGAAYYISDEYYYDPLPPFSTALMLNDWIEEAGERELAAGYSTTPGVIYNKIRNADWLLYASMELAKLTHVQSLPLLEIRVRMRYGIKKELLDLVRLEQVGRVRARALYSNGIKSVKDLRSEEGRMQAERIFGKETAKRILAQLD